MDLTRKDTKMLQGLAIVFMVLLHLFCRKGELPYQPLIYAGNIPIVYYLGLLGDCCVLIYSFCSGYGHYTSYVNENSRGGYVKTNRKIFN